MYIYGRNAIVESLGAGAPIEKIFVQYGLESPSLAAVRIQAEKRGVRCATMDKRKFQTLEREICGESGKAQGVIALVSTFKTLDVGELIERSFAASDVPLLVALDGVTDPHNVGAIARSAECAGFSGLIAPEHKSAPLGGAAMKASAGALQHLPTAKTGNLAKALEDCRNAGFRVVALDAEAESSYLDARHDDLFKNEALALVVGSEGEGIGKAVRRVCTDDVRIPLYGKISSLNASVAAALVIFEIVRRRTT